MAFGARAPIIYVLVLSTGLIVTLCTQVAHIDRVSVPAPRTIGIKLDNATFSFMFMGGCRNQSDEQYLMSQVTCPKDPNTHETIAVMSSGCIGNPEAAHALTEPLMGAGLTAGFVVFIAIVAVSRWSDPRDKEDKLCYWISCGIGLVILVSFSWMFYGVFCSFEPMVQCPPIMPLDANKNNFYHFGFMGGANLNVLTAGCIGHVTTQSDYLRVAAVVPSCPYATFDADSNTLTVKAKASQKVLAAIKQTKDRLLTGAYVASSFGGALVFAFCFRLCS